MRICIAICYSSDTRALGVLQLAPSKVNTMRRQFGGAFTAPAKALPRSESAGQVSTWVPPAVGGSLDATAIGIWCVQGRPRHDIHVVRADVKVEPCARERHVQFVQASCNLRAAQ